MALDELELSVGEKKELADLAEGNLHHEVLDAVLSELDERDKEMFVRLLQEGDHKKVWDFLDARVLNIEKKIVEAAAQLKEKMHEDIRLVKEEKKKGK